MSNVVNMRDYKKEIQRLEDKKWDILLRHGQTVAAVLWAPIDARLSKLYSWWVNEMYKLGRERELPFHLRRRE